MKKGENFNHPKKNSRIRVDPIRSLKAIKNISALTKVSPRDHLLFIMGVNSGLRTGDLLKLKVKDVCHLKCGETLIIKEGKTNKQNILVINKSIFKALKLYKEILQPNENNPLFQSRKKKKSISVQHVNHLVKKWTQTVGLVGNFGAHTLRKSWGYSQRVHFGVGFEVIAKRFQHSNPSITMVYLGIEDKEVHTALLRELG